MNANKPISRRSFGSDLGQVDAHTVGAEAYAELAELPELTGDMLVRAKVTRGAPDIGAPAQAHLAACPPTSSSV